MTILVLSCDKDDDLFYPFYHCMEKYWPNHPKIYYATENIDNPYYDTIKINYPLNKWTRRIRETLRQINDEHILIMIDDCFIRQPVDIDRLNYIDNILKDNMAMINLEKSFDENDMITNFKDIKKRQKGASYALSLLCGVWQKDKLISILSNDSDPWTVEYKQDTKSYDYYINSGDYVIDWGYVTWHQAGVVKGKWQKEVIPFFEKEGIIVDYNRRGFND